MKTSEAIWMFLPEGLDELFDFVRIEKIEKAYYLWLDEKKKSFFFLFQLYLAERQGFEPWVPKRHNGFRDRPDRPLRHLSIEVSDSDYKITINYRFMQINMLSSPIILSIP